MVSTDGKKTFPPCKVKAANFRKESDKVLSIHVANAFNEALPIIKISTHIFPSGKFLVEGQICKSCKANVNL